MTISVEALSGAGAVAILLVMDKLTSRDMSRRSLLKLAAGTGIAVGAGALGAFQTAPAFAAGTSAAKVLFIDIDGLRHDKLVAANTPAIDALAAQGQFVRGWTHDTSQARTDSGPGHSNLLTGVWPAKHGVKDNTFAGSRIAQYPDFLTRLERRNSALRTFSSADWAPINANIIGAIDTKITPNAGSVSANDDATVANAQNALRTTNPDAMLVYFHSVDSTGHASGSDSAAYTQAIQATDARVAKVVAAVKARSGYSSERWLIIVASDHGFSGSNHGGPEETTRRVPIIAVGSGIAVGARREWSQVDIVPTALSHLGVPIDPAWGLDGARIY